MDGVVMEDQERYTRTEVWCKISLGQQGELHVWMYVCTWMGEREGMNPQISHSGRQSCIIHY